MLLVCGFCCGFCILLNIVGHRSFQSPVSRSLGLFIISLNSMSGPYQSIQLRRCSPAEKAQHQPQISFWVFAVIICYHQSPLCKWRQTAVQCGSHFTRAPEISNRGSTGSFPASKGGRMNQYDLIWAAAKQWERKVFNELLLYMRCEIYLKRRRGADSCLSLPCQCAIFPSWIWGLALARTNDWVGCRRQHFCQGGHGVHANGLMELNLNKCERKGSYCECSRTKKWKNSKTCCKRFYLNKTVGETEIQLSHSRRSVFTSTSTVPGKRMSARAEMFGFALRLPVFVF